MTNEIGAYSHRIQDAPFGSELLYSATPLLFIDGHSHRQVADPEARGRRGAVGVDTAREENTVRRSEREMRGETEARMVNEGVCQFV